MGVKGVGREGTYWGLGARTCDGCKEAAVLFCRADAAFLCGTCDSCVHGANKLASRHERVWLCEVCEQVPAALTCKDDAAAICASCDDDIHAANPLASRHHRLPIAPFLNSSAFASAPALLYSGDADTNTDDDDGNSAAASWMMPKPPAKDPPPEIMKSAADCFFSDDVDPYLDLDYGSSVEASMYHADSVVPAAVGAPTSYSGLNFCRSKAPYSGFSVSHSMLTSEVGVVPDGGGSTIANVLATSASCSGGGRSSMAAAAAAVAGGMDREARVMRYREKRKNRRFEKTIRYASRKAYAETRPRIKGRFAKRTDVEAKVDRIYSLAAATTAADPGYGIVPSF